MWQVRGLLIRASGRVFPFRETESSGSPWKHISGSCFAPMGIFELAERNSEGKQECFRLTAFLESLLSCFDERCSQIRYEFWLKKGDTVST